MCHCQEYKCYKYVCPKPRPEPIPDPCRNPLRDFLALIGLLYILKDLASGASVLNLPLAVTEEDLKAKLEDLVTLQRKEESCEERPLLDFLALIGLLYILKGLFSDSDAELFGVSRADVVSKISGSLGSFSELLNL